MKKIYVNKTDLVALIIEKVIKSPDEEVTLYIPRESVLTSSRNNFKLLKREAESAGKILRVESVDEDALELADSFDIKSINPFFGKKKSVTDIVVKGAKPEIAPHPNNEKISKTLFFKNAIFGLKKGESELWKTAPAAAKEAAEPPTLKRLTIIATIAGLVILLSWVALNVLPRAKIKLVVEKINWDFSGSVVVSSNRETANFTDSTLGLPGVVFTEKRNLTKSYIASGSERVERKARGKITVYNEYSSEPQVLIQNTRFAAPDGKVYRTDLKVTVPGAKIVDGKIVSSNIEVPVSADKAGEEYNIGPIPKFRIPGFQGSPKYEAFYGVSTGEMSRGFVGDKKAPTEDDIAKAKKDLRSSLEGALKTQIFLGAPTDIKILDKAYEFSITKEEVNKETDANGNFTITDFGEMKAAGFKEADLLSVLANKVASESNTDLVLYEHSLESLTEGYGEPKLDFKNGKMTFSLNFKSGWVRSFDLEEFKARIAGKNKSEITSLVYSVPGFKSGGVSLWPVWVRYAPKNPRKISVDLDYTL